IHIDLDRIVAAGRAESLEIPLVGQRPLVREIPLGACDVAHQPSLDCDGAVLACCNTNRARRVPALQLGRLQDSSFEELSRRADPSLAATSARTVRTSCPSRIL